MVTPALKTPSTFRCPICHERDNEVRDSRPRSDGLIQRRRYCNSCSATIRTVEVPLEIWDALAAQRSDLDRSAQTLNAFIASFNTARRAIRKIKPRSDVVMLQRKDL